MVTVKMKPIKRTIRISAEDAESAKAVKDVKLEIVAAEDIKAADGTVRYPSGKVVEKLTTNDKGSAESKELYIGKYSVKQASAPKYYAVDPKAVAASVTEDSGTDKGLIKIDCVKTKVTVTLTDERTEKPIKGAVYELEGKDELTTDSNGQITITDLNKSTGYKLNVKSVPKGYHKKSKELSFKVDGKGLVKDEVSHELNDTAYTISLDVRVRDYFFGRKAKGVDLQLLDENKNVIDEWTTNNTEHIITGLSEGKYFVQRLNDEGSQITVNIRDTSELQRTEMKVWDTIDLFAVLMAGGLVIAAGLVFGLLIKRREKVRRTNEK